MSISARFIRNSLSSLVVAGLLAGAAWVPATAADKVTYAYGTNISLSNAPTLMAIGMGYFKDEDLDVDVTFFQGAAAQLPQIAQKHVTFGWINPNVLISARQPGRDPLPVKMFYNGIGRSSYEVVVPEGSEIRALKDLKGKKIGVGAMSWGNLAITKSMLKEEGLELQRDYTFVPVGVGATAFRALTSGEIDALNLFDTFHVQLEQQGTKIRRLPEQEKYRALFSSGWGTHQDTLRDNPELVVRFARAASKGVIACQANVQACVENFWKLYPATKPSAGTEQEKLADAVAQLQVRLDTMIDANDVRKTGLYRPQVWSDYVQVLQTGGEIATTDIATDVLYTNDLVARINDFDVEAVRAQARAR